MRVILLLLQIEGDFTRRQWLIRLGGSNVNEANNVSDRIQGKMTSALQDQVAIVTGGASGLGLAILNRLISLGATGYAFDQNEEALRGNQERLGEGAEGVVVDVTNEGEVRERVKAIAAKEGRIDVLVNCAGVTGKTNIKSHEVDVDELKHVFEVNLVGCFITSKWVLPVMLKRRYGRILHIASISGKDGNAGMLAYSSSKAAVIGMTKVQGKEYAESGITINALAPAVVETPMVEAMPEEQVKYMTDKIPMKRCGRLEEVASIAAFIVSREASFTTGFTFDLTGGRAVY